MALFTRSYAARRSVMLTRSTTGAVQHRYLNGPLVDQVLADDKLSGTPAVRWLLADEQQTPRKLLQPGELVQRIFLRIVRYIKSPSFNGIASRNGVASGLNDVFVL